MKGGEERYPVFDALRVLAALFVIGDHSFALVGQPEIAVLRLPGLTWGLGHLGVIVFFVTSGFLVTMSWQRDPSAARFAVRRVLRIWPAFVVVILGVALVIGPAMTSLPRGTYLSDGAVWGYIGHNLVMSPIQLSLPGVFTTNPHSGVNGSLWTLPYEVLCYAVLVVLGVCRLVRPLPLVLAFVGALGVYRIGVHERSVDLIHSVNGIFGIYLVALGVWFLAGMILAHYRHLIAGRHAVGAAAIALTLAGRLANESLLLIPALAVAIIYIGTLPLPRAEVVRRWGDPSYGMYVWAWPIQQLVVSLRTPPLPPGVVALVSAVGATIAGYASWHLVEARALRLSRRWTRGRGAEPDPTGAVPETVGDAAIPA